jgi:hypothetical protein
MGRSALVIGATGQVGHAAVRALAQHGWQVRAGARHPAPDGHWPAELGVETVLVDHNDDAALAAALNPGFDVAGAARSAATRSSSPSLGSPPRSRSARTTASGSGSPGAATAAGSTTSATCPTSFTPNDATTGWPDTTAARQRPTHSPTRPTSPPSGLAAACTMIGGNR